MTPCSASSFASLISRSMGTLLKFPRIFGIMQYVQCLSHPSAIFKYAKCPPVVTRRFAPETGSALRSESIMPCSPSNARSTASKILSYAVVPRTSSTSGISSNISCLYLCARHPVTINAFTCPDFLYSAISRMVSTLSSLASLIKQQVLITMASACVSSSTIS